MRYGYWLPMFGGWPVAAAVLLLGWPCSVDTHPLLCIA